MRRILSVVVTQREKGNGYGTIEWYPENYKS